MVCGLTDSELSEMYEKLPWWCVNRIRGGKRWEDELLTVARVQFVKCLNNWNPERGVKFSTFATFSINRHLWSKMIYLKKRPKFVKLASYEEMDKDWLDRERDSRIARNAGEVLEERGAKHKLLAFEMSLLRELAKGQTITAVAAQEKMSFGGVARWLEIIKDKVNGVEFSKRTKGTV